MGALTGADTDRLPEEKKRGISIDLGFARLTLTDGTAASVVDVPGHERFVRNMVAGSYGIDMALVVVAADEGVMPQTREHLDIIDLLGVGRGVVAVTKSDLVDEELRDLAVEEVREELSGGALQDAPVLPVSAVTGEGMDELLDALTQVATAIRGERTQAITGSARLPVDRAFTVAGIGTVVTGTLRGDSMTVGQELEIVPGRQRTRARSLQVHGGKVDVAHPGSRVAVNLPGLSVDDVSRGVWVTEPHRFDSHRVLAAEIRLLPGEYVLREGDILSMHLATAEVSARVSVLEGDAIGPGEVGFVRIHPRGGIPAAFGDRFILRRPSPVDTVAGGWVLDIRGYRYRRGRREALDLLGERASGNPERRLLAALAGVPSFRFPADVGEIERDLGVAAGSLGEITDGLEARGEVLRPAGEVIILRRDWDAFVHRVSSLAEEVVTADPLSEGVSVELARDRLYPSMDSDAFADLVDAAAALGPVRVRGGRIAPADHEPRPDEETERVARELIDLAASRGLSPMTREEVVGELPPDVGRSLVDYLVRRGELVVAGDFLVARRPWDSLVRSLDEWFEGEETITVSQLRQMADTTRKYAVPLAEALDGARLTVRRGDLRYRGPRLAEFARGSR